MRWTLTATVVSAILVVPSAMLIGGTTIATTMLILLFGSYLDSRDSES